MIDGVPPSVSVIVANRGREWLLSLTLSALHRQRGVRAQIIVVSDTPVPRDLGVIWLHEPQANIALARNSGLRVASGEIVAFCDDDAVPEPDWLQRLLDGFDDPTVGAVGGPVLGPDGVRVQWDETGFDSAGRDCADGPFRKLNGTNMALRRDAIAAIGGFDPRFAYYLDETDMLLRMSQRGWETRWQPLALVHHATSPNAVRGAGLKPEGFCQLGRSTAAFAQSHAPDLQAEAAMHLRSTQARRLRAMFNIGAISAAQLAACRAALEDGLTTPAPSPSHRPAPRPTPREASAKPPVPAKPELPQATEKRRIALAPRILGRRAARRVARALAAQGHEVTLIVQTWLNRPMRVRWQPEGYFEHRGGVFRDGNHLPVWRRMLMAEVARIAPQRAFTTLFIGTRTGGVLEFDLSADGVTSDFNALGENSRKLPAFDVIKPEESPPQRAL